MYLSYEVRHMWDIYPMKILCMILWKKLYEDQTFRDPSEHYKQQSNYPMSIWPPQQIHNYLLHLVYRLDPIEQMCQTLLPVISRFSPQTKNWTRLNIKYLYSYSYRPNNKFHFIFLSMSLIVTTWDTRLTGPKESPYLSNVVW